MNPPSTAKKPVELKPVLDPILEAKVKLAETAPEAALIQLMDDPDEIVREVLAQNPHLPKSCLDVLAGSSNDRIRASSAENPNTRPETLAALSRDPVAGVRWKTVSNPNTPSEILDGFAAKYSEDPNVLRSVSENLNCHPATLDKLATLGIYIQRGVAANPNTNPATLDSLSQIPDELLQYRVAGNPNSGTIALVRLSTHSQPIIREAVASNLSTPAATRRSLESDPHTKVSDAARAHRPINFEQVNREITDGTLPDENTRRRIALAARNGDPEAREALQTLNAADDNRPYQGVTKIPHERFVG